MSGAAHNRVHATRNMRSGKKENSKTYRNISFHQIRRSTLFRCLFQFSRDFVRFLRIRPEAIRRKFARDR